jgi:hypothetical protein
MIPRTSETKPYMEPTYRVLLGNITRGGDENRGYRNHTIFLCERSLEVPELTLKGKENGSARTVCSTCYHGIMPD